MSSEALLAIEDALAGCPADEIVIAILPPGRSNWVERGLVEKATARFGIPVAHIVSGNDLIEGAASKPARAAAMTDARVRTAESRTQTE